MHSSFPRVSSSNKISLIVRSSEFEGDRKRVLATKPSSGFSESSTPLEFVVPFEKTNFRGDGKSLERKMSEISKIMEGSSTVLLACNSPEIKYMSKFVAS